MVTIKATVVQVVIVPHANTPIGRINCSTSLAARAAAHPLRFALALCAQ